jgi:hypothetical protein
MFNSTFKLFRTVIDLKIINDSNMVIKTIFLIRLNEIRIFISIFFNIFQQKELTIEMIFYEIILGLFVINFTDQQRIVHNVFTPKEERVGLNMFKYLFLNMIINLDTRFEHIKINILESLGYSILRTDGFIIELSLSLHI